LRSKLQLAFAGLVDGRRSTGRPSARVWRIERADSPPLWAIARSPGARSRRLARSFSTASSIALSRLPARRQLA